jgi:SNF2 family DNA or RNA helicase
MQEKGLEPLWPSMKYEEFQKEGIHWMIKQKSLRGGILGDEMGLGKTIQVLGFIKNSEASKSLLIGPLAVLGQWRDVAIKSGFKVYEYEKRGWSAMPSKSDKILYLINYEKLKGLAYSFYKIKWTNVICDEAHRLRNMGISFEKIQTLQYEAIYILTATPIVNSINDVIPYYILLGVMDEDKKTFNLDDWVLVRRYTMARNRAAVDAKKELEFQKNSVEILSILSAKFGEAIAANIVEKAGVSKITSEVELKVLEFCSEDEEEFYQGIQGGIMKRWKALESENSSLMLVLLMRLRQLSIHPQVYIQAKKDRMPEYEREDWLAPSTKFLKAWSLINEESVDHNWILFCNFRNEIGLLKKFLRDSGFKGRIHTYDGSMNQREREAAILASKEAGVQHIFLVQIHAGGTGINLQHFSRAIFLSPWWTSALMDQAAGRLVRIGQLKHVKIYHLLMEGEVGINIDRKMRTAVEKKRDILEKYLMEALH